MVNLIIGFLGLFFLIGFIFTMDSILKQLKEINKKLTIWSAINGHNIQFKCSNPKCNKVYQGKLPKCPHCGIDKTYS